jgi:S-adenosylmethionine:tRNA ribosyltransferase-isomerase
VGTTATRALESAVDEGRVVARQGWTERVVTPARPPHIVTGLVTGWHDPQASHLLLVEAVAGARLAQRAYEAASRGGYRWHEFGDAALFLP